LRTKMDLPLDRVIKGDCVEVLNNLPEKSVDLIFADPPYNLQLAQDLYRPNMTRVNGVDDTWDKFDSFEDYDVFTRQWLSACRRVLKDTGTIWVIGSYHNIFRVGAILMDLGYWILNDVVWIKPNPIPNFRGVRFTNAHETLIWAQKIKKAKYTFNHHAMKFLNDDENDNGLQMRSNWEVPVCNGNERIKDGHGNKAHSTQKPEQLLYRVISSSSNLNDVVLDPFFGTGTTGAVAKKLRRHWVGIEQNSDYIKLARKRIKAIKPGKDDKDIYKTKTKRDLPRIPFGSLIERGYITPGQKLFFGKRGKAEAIVLANGQIQSGDFVGSIHKVGSYVQGAPCNGWEHWFIKTDGLLQTIDTLREKYRESMKEEINV
jgi:site-specific DNA-methyltransferase (adenine-specific)